MGVLRLLLAISVVFGHVSFSGAFTGPTIAVETFYIISGFYIGLVLDTTAAYRSATAFYINRYLRLFPVYLVVAVFAVILALRSEPAAIQDFLALPPVARALLAFSNATLFLQDWVMFLGTQGGHLHLVRNVHDAQPRPLYEFLAIPPAWSLGCELTFYLLAPYLVRLRDRWLLGVIGLSLLARGVGLALGLHDDPWSYRFFPFELALFGLGVMTYRLYTRYRYTWIQDRRLRVPVIAIFFCLTVVLSGVSLPGKRPLYLALACLTLPFLFDVTKRLRWDRRIGDLSYPVYISHQFVRDLWLSSAFCKRLCPSGIPLSLIICACSILFSLLLNRVVQDPVESFRQRRKLPGSAVDRAEHQQGVPVAAE